MKRRSAVACPLAPGVTKKADGFALPVTAVGIAAVAAFELDQGKPARIDFDAAQLERLRALENRHRPRELGCIALAQSAQQRRFGAPGRPEARRLLGRDARA